MTHAEIYENTVASILKLAVNFIADNDPTADFFNWDAHSLDGGDAARHAAGDRPWPAAAMDA